MASIIKAHFLVFSTLIACSSSHTNDLFGPSEAGAGTGGQAGSTPLSGAAGVVAIDSGGAAGTVGVDSGGVAGAGGSAGEKPCATGEQRDCSCDSATGTQVCTEGVFGVCENSGMCCGAPGGWIGCETNGCAVCAELVSGYPHYFDNHPDCYVLTGCNANYGKCSSSCPAPSSEDL